MDFNFSNDPFSLSGRTILVTGASSGIGRECAVTFSKRGANVVLIGRNQEGLLSAIRECDKQVDCAYYSYDLSDLSGIGELVSEVVEKHGPINGFLHSAGIQKTLPYSHCSVDDFHSIYDVNLLSAIEMIKHLSKKKNKGPNSRYVLISSITAIVGRPGVVAYAASKGAMVSAVKSMSIELAAKGIAINCISPGTVMTPLMESMMESLTDEQRQKRKEGFLLGMGQPSDIANASVFLLSDASRWITGQNIVVDGGYTVQ